MRLLIVQHSNRVAITDLGMEIVKPYVHCFVSRRKLSRM